MSGDSATAIALQSRGRRKPVGDADGKAAKIGSIYFFCRVTMRPHRFGT